MEGRNILISDRWRLRYLDKFNYVLEEWRRPKVAEIKGETVDQSPKWYPINGAGYGPFFPSIGAALVWLLNYRMLNDGDGTITLEEAIAEMRRIAEELKNVRVEC